MARRRWITCTGAARIKASTPAGAPKPGTTLVSACAIHRQPAFRLPGGSVHSAAMGTLYYGDNLDILRRYSNGLESRRSVFAVLVAFCGCPAGIVHVPVTPFA